MGEEYEGQMGGDWGDLAEEHHTEKGQKGRKESMEEKK